MGEQWASSCHLGILTLRLPVTLTSNVLGGLGVRPCSADHGCQNPPHGVVGMGPGGLHDGTACGNAAEAVCNARVTHKVAGVLTASKGASAAP